MHTHQHRWDIFCKVIDNYGDIGVCWRLARQLAGDQGQQVRLWLDDLKSLQRLWPQAQIGDQALVEGVEIRQWSADFPSDINPAQRVIEAFACDIPQSYLAAMAAAKGAGQAPLWFNLEYLSAEDWIEDCHGLDSVHPATGLRKTFFFPGFSPRTGGLLREQSLLAERGQHQAEAWLAGLGVKPYDGALRLSLFAYENPGIALLIDHWRQAPCPIHCLVPSGKILTSISAATGQSLNPGQPLQLGNLRLELIPFVSQTDYDRLLWSCDLNFVRGEDSFVRAQWAGKPFIWHIYLQEEQAHLVKLNAFLQRYTQGMPGALAAGLNALWHGWNPPQDQSQLANHWQSCMAHWPQWQAHSQGWCQQLAQQADLASQLLALARAKNTTESP